MKKVPFCLIGLMLLVSLLASCGPGAHKSSSETKEFFENTRRRAANVSERNGIAKLGGCTAFFVKNSSQKVMVMSARHCVSYNMDQWCRNGGNVKDAHTGVSHQCKKIIAGDGSHDPVLIEVYGSRFGKTFDLASYYPQQATRLRMYGYPADPYATGGLMASENCWVHNPLVRNPYIGSEYWDKGLQDKVFSHNCSTYGGNSGGPILVEGTSHVMGLPYEYSKNNYGNQIFSNHSTAAALADFVKTHRGSLDRERVSIATSAARSFSGNYFKASTYASSSLNCDFAIIPLYLTSDLLTQVKVRFECQEGGYEVFKCSQNTGYCEFKNSYIYDLSSNGFSYQDPNGGKHSFQHR